MPPGGSCGQSDQCFTNSTACHLFKLGSCEQARVKMPVLVLTRIGLYRLYPAFIGFTGSGCVAQISGAAYRDIDIPPAPPKRITIDRAVRMEHNGGGRT